MSLALNQSVGTEEKVGDEPKSTSLSKADLNRLLTERGFAEVPSCSCGKKADAIAARVRDGLSRDSAVAEVEAKIATSGLKAVEVEASVAKVVATPETSPPQKTNEDEHSTKHEHEKTSPSEQEDSGGLGATIDSIASWVSGVDVSSMMSGFATGASEVVSRISSFANGIQNAFTDLISTTSELEREVGRFGTEEYSENLVEKLKADAELRLDTLDRQISEAHCELASSENLNPEQRNALREKLDEALEQKAEMEEGLNSILEKIDELEEKFGRDTQQILNCCDEHGVCDPHKNKVEEVVGGANREVGRLTHSLKDHIAEIRNALEEGDLERANELYDSLDEHSEEIGADIEGLSRKVGREILEHAHSSGESTEYLDAVETLSTQLVENQRHAWEEVTEISSHVSAVGRNYVDTLGSIRDMGVNLGDIAVLGVARTDAALRSKWTPGTLYTGDYAMSDLYFYAEVEKLEKGTPFPMEPAEEGLSGSFGQTANVVGDSIDVFNKNEPFLAETFASVIERPFEQAAAANELNEDSIVDSEVRDEHHPNVLASVSTELERHLGSAIESFLRDDDSPSAIDDELGVEDA